MKINYLIHFTDSADRHPWVKSCNRDESPTWTSDKDKAQRWETKEEIEILTKHWSGIEIIEEIIMEDHDFYYEPEKRSIEIL